MPVTCEALSLERLWPSFSDQSCSPMRSWIWTLGTARHVCLGISIAAATPILPQPPPYTTLPHLNRKRQGSHTGSCSHRSLLVSCWQVDRSWFPGFWPSPDTGLASRAFLTGSQPLCSHWVPVRAQHLSVGPLHLLPFPSLEEGHPYAGPRLYLGREVLAVGHLESY